MPILGQTQPRLEAGAAMCVRNVNVLLPAIHINSRSWLRSSSIHEPSDPPLGVVFLFVCFQIKRDVRFQVYKGEGCHLAGRPLALDVRLPDPCERLLIPRRAGARAVARAPTQAHTARIPREGTRAALGRTTPTRSERGTRKGPQRRRRAIHQHGVGTDAIKKKEKNNKRVRDR